MTKTGVSTPLCADRSRAPFQHGQSRTLSNACHGYAVSQVERYLRDRIGVPEALIEPKSLEILTMIVKRHHSHVTFDNLDLHYSKHHEISLEPEHLYHKFVVRRRGGDCLENNTFLANILRGLGFKVTTVGVRVNSSWDGSSDIDEFEAFTHMVLIIPLDGKKYSVDAHFGGKEPSKPLLLEPTTAYGSSKENSNMKIIWDNINGSEDPAQKMWIYQYRNSCQQEWKSVYAFSEQEFFPADFAIISYYLTTLRRSWYTYILVCNKTLLNLNDDVVGSIRLVGNKIKEKVEGKDTILKVCGTENERVEALEKYFGITLSGEERVGISGLVTEIRPPPEL